MPSCMRCGERLAHNYLVAIFTIINEKRKRLIVCSKCREILIGAQKSPAFKPGMNAQRLPADALVADNPGKKPRTLPPEAAPPTEKAQGDLYKKGNKTKT